MPEQINLTKFVNKTIDATFTKEQFDIATALFSLAGVNVSKLLADSNHEAFISELEAPSNSITDKFLEYWSTNKNLEIQFEIQTIGGDKLLNIRIRNPDLLDKLSDITLNKFACAFAKINKALN